MKELVENIESEIADLKKTMSRWDEIGDASLLKVAQRNIAHAQDWMSLLNEILIKKSQNAEQKESLLVPAVNDSSNISVVDNKEKSPSPISIESISINEDKESLPKEDLEVIAEDKEEEILPSEPKREPTTALIPEPEDFKSQERKSEVLLSHSISTTSVQKMDEQGKAFTEERREHRSFLSQSYEEKAKTIDRKEDLIKETSILGDHLLKMEKGIYASLSLNDIFRFSREWFEGNSKQLELFLKNIEESLSFEDAIQSAQRTLSVVDESESWHDLTEVIEKYFKG